MKEIKILGIEKKQRSKKYKLITSDESIKDWENMNGFTYHYCPRIVEKRNSDANS